MDARMHYLYLLHSSYTKGVAVSSYDKAIVRSLEEWVLFRKYRDSAEDVESIAAALGVPRDEVTSYIHGWLGERFLSVRKRLRVHDAGELLLDHPEMTTAQIARAVGFQDKSDFRRAFKDETGYSPRFWRENGGNRLRCRATKILEACRSRCHARCTTS